MDVIIFGDITFARLDDGGHSVDAQREICIFTSSFHKEVRGQHQLQNIAFGFDRDSVF